MTPTKNKGLYALSDSNLANEKELLEKTETILRLGLCLFQYRNKEHKHNYHDLALSLQDLCQQYHCPFIVNDDVQLAKNIKADGVHLGQHDNNIKETREFLGNGLIIGASCYNKIELAELAYQAGANYVAFGAFSPSVNKPNAVKAETSLIKQVKIKIPLPIVAIGGITPQNANKIIQAGADYLAVISGLYTSKTIEHTYQQYMQHFN